MRYRITLLLILTVLAAAPLAGQTGKPTPAEPVDTRPADLLAELGKSVYIAKRAIPACDGILVEGGRVMESVFALNRQEKPSAVSAGNKVTVSKVLLLDKAVHVFFAEDKFALLILAKEGQAVADMTLPQLLKLSEEGIRALFTAQPAEKPASKPVTTTEDGGPVG